MHCSRSSRATSETFPSPPFGVGVFFESTDFYIWDCCNLFQSISDEISPIMVVFRVWFYIKYTDLLINQSDQEMVKNTSKNYNFENKSKFLELLPYIIKSKYQH